MKPLLAALLPAAATGLLLAASSAAAEEAWVVKGTADLILLDKIRAQPSPVSVKTGDTTVFGSLSVRVRSCFGRPPDRPSESTAFVEVTDSRTKSDVFRGWIFANVPAVSQMEHPVYDLRLSGCR